MYETEQICPYTGLRSFTEEESLYFKGREDDIDQATQQLQRNKFLMLTGASGDGKSSLIYAGIIPNARAGFLKSRYTNWCVADFRPERTPFQNLCRAVARELGIASPQTVQAELNHGFSALVDLYKNSPRYIDTGADAWVRADDREKAALKREAANLVILVDQFEEFFTNPENYHRGVPSAEANLVLNLLLETARIALDEDLPVYVVFTMRSDFIGQCAAFRGLPEYIGFSQFFVPRLNRSQLQQVIEEPAVLSGNRITRRLTERLIHDLTEGVDQLPIVQHALNQVWHAADNGKEEMDLIHYAMVGGMPVQELPEEQVERFNQWFAGLAPEIRACYHKPDLQNVLDTHTNKLFEQASDYYTQHTGKFISGEEAKAIIKTAFTCLTKIDQSRAVRNRMTLREITDIIGRPEFGTEEVGVVLNIFREPGNTFIRPFITDEGESRNLQETDVLDITHESLIRNWEYLGQWAKEEFDHYTVSLDFEQQLNRWVESGKSNDFLLPIGPLTYFESWFRRVKPNAHWIARYLPEEIEEENKLSRAEQVLGHARHFLKKSAARHVVTRTVMRYGAKKIGITLGIVTLVVLGFLGIRDYMRKQNSSVLRSIKEQTLEIANVPKLSPEFPIPVITAQLRLGNITIPEVMTAVRDSGQKIKIATGIATQLVMQGRYEPKKEIRESLAAADSLLEQLTISGNSREVSEKLKLIHDFSVTAGLAHLFGQDEYLRSLVRRNAQRSARWAQAILHTQPAGFTDIQNLSLVLDNAIQHRILSPEQIWEIIGILSPFENPDRSPWVEENYQRDKLLVRGSHNYGPRFNGLFQDLAYLYAAAGRTDRVLQCLDSLLHYQAGFYQNDYASHVENASHIAAVYYHYGNLDKLDSFVTGYCSRKNVSRPDFFERLVCWSQPNTAVLNFYAGAGGQVMSNTSLQFASDDMLRSFFSMLKAECLNIPDKSERNFRLAIINRNEGVFRAYRNEIRGTDSAETDSLFRNAVRCYREVAGDYLDQPVSLIGSSGADIISMPRRFLFLYPDFRVPFHPLEPRGLALFYYSSAFVGYLLDHNEFDALYDKDSYFRYFEPWLSDYNVLMSSRNVFITDPMPHQRMEQLAARLEARNASKSADLNLLYLHLNESFLQRGDTAKALACIERIQPDKLLNSFQYKLLNFVNGYSFELAGRAIAVSALVRRFDLVLKVLRPFKKEVNRSSLYAYASQLISLQKASPELALQLVDSARTEMNRLYDPAAQQPNRHQVAMALMYLNPGRNSAEAYRIIKNRNNKFESVTRFSRAFALQGNLYKAMRQVPALISTGDRAAFLRNTVEGHAGTSAGNREWEKFQNNQLIFTRRFLFYVNENE